ncbi:MAG: heparin lyase I family protein [Hahellaceae bacterium]|nr:heparin lyase I family protein [Hahellaceae bacterium]
MYNLLKTLAVLSAVQVPVAAAGVLLDADFESGTYKDLNWNVSGNAPVVTNSGVTACSGKYVMRVDLNRYTSNTSYRTEVGNILFGNNERNLDLFKTYWMSLAIYLPSDWKDDPNEDILFQLHDQPDSGEPWKHPAMALKTSDDRWKVSILADSRSISDGSNYSTSASMDLGALKRGSWTTIVMQTRISYKSDGFLNVWVNGNLKSYSGPIGFNDKLGPYIKIGNYKPAWQPGIDWGINSGVSTRRHYVDEVRVGDSAATVSSMTPNCGGGAESLDPAPPYNISVY